MLLNIAGVFLIDDFYKSAEYPEIVADVEAVALLKVGQPGSEVGGAALFIRLWLGVVTVV
ncbi:MAG: hypothetical protein AAF329_00390 [Cyanobacteria bacterium P01_A01_bin.17]